jgi:hypothetical protein
MRLRIAGCLAVVGVLAPALSGCGVPAAMTLAPKAHLPKPGAHTVYAKLSAPAREPGELDNGSAAHALTVDGIQLMLNYWASGNPSEWNPASQGTVNVSAQVQGLPNNIIARITGFQVVAPPGGPGQPNSTLVSDSGDFVINAPYSYGSAFVMPQFAGGTKMVTLHVFLDLQIETAPNSGNYTRQSVIDTLRVSLVPKTQGSAPRTVPDPVSNPTTQENS